MTNNEYRKNAYCVLYLISCILNHKNPSAQKLNDIDYNNLYIVAKAHSLTSIIAYSLELCGIENHRFREGKYQAIKKDILFDSEQKSITNKLDELNIWYVPLKGMILKSYYPDVYMRQMADNDILIDESHRKDVYNIMTEKGYKIESYGTGNCDAYHKLPVYNFEMHAALFSEAYNNRFIDYYSKIKKRLLRVEKNRCEYKLSNEDFYVYMTAHEYKHYSVEGTGLRSLVDAYVFLNRFSKSLNMKYIEKELDVLGIKEYEYKRRQLIHDLFGKGKINIEQRKLLDYYIFSGTYGNIQNSVKNATDKTIRSKCKYIISRIFLPLSIIKCRYPFFYKHKYLIPYLYMYRIIHVLTTNSDRILYELKLLKKR